MAHSILDVARELVDSPDAKAAYADDPAGFMAARGLDGLSDAEIEEAVGFVADAMPAPVARQLVSPPGPVTDPLPLARVAAATSMEVAVLEAEPGTVDLTALADPSGQLDLPTDLSAAGAAEVPPEAETEAVEEEPLDSAPAEEEEAVAEETDFGRGALDETEDLPGESPADADEGDEPDSDSLTTGLDEDGVTKDEPEFDLAEGVDAPVGEVATSTGKHEEPPEDDFEDVII
ncbi:MAG: hypothetical protein ACT4PI_03595 [Actinomycetota bacterium]